MWSGWRIPACSAVLFATSCGLSTGPLEDGAFDLVRALEERGALVEDVEPIPAGEPFTVEGRVLRVDGHLVHAFEFGSPRAASELAASVSPDGTEVGGADRVSIITWIGPPHLFLAEEWIAAYVGSESLILGLLADVMGPQFAGASD